MFKRVFLFILTNLAVLILLSVVLFILESYFWIKLTGNYYILTIAVVFWFWWAFISLFLSKWMAKKAYKLVLINFENLDKLDEKEKLVWNVVSELSERKHIKMPEVGVYKDKDPNAFATWATKNSSLVAVSTGLLETMDKKAIEWVVGHEMAHILNWDMVTMTLLQWILNTFVIFFARILGNIFNNVTDWKFWIWWYYGVVIALEIIFWILASTIVMWFSRHREYRADEWSAKMVWKEKMIAWLEALKRLQDLASPDSSQLATMKISTKKKTWFRALFSSHPDLDDRIKSLEKLIIN